MPESGRIRVLLTTPHLLSTASPYREVMAIAKYLPRDEFDLTVCTLRDRGLDLAGPSLKAFGVRAFAARFRPTQFTRTGIMATFCGQRLMAQYGPFDVQHSLDWTSSPFEALLAHSAGRRFVYHQRNLNEDGSPFGLRFKVYLSNHIICIAEAAARVALAHGAPPERVTSVPLGLDLESLSPPRDRPPGEGLLSVGQIIPRKRHEDAIRVLASLLPSYPSLRLRIAGPVFDEGYHQCLRRLASSLGVSSRVEFLRVREDVLQLMASSQVLLHCAESEAFGWVILEAWSAGLPVVASRSGGPEEVITNGETGYLAPTGDISALTGAVRAVLGAPDRAATIARGARKVLEERYSARTMVESIAEVYRAVAFRANNQLRWPRPEQSPKERQDDPAVTQRTSYKYRLLH
jgi:glycosyltransferase involved in cell wall biosynthesis